MLTRAAQRAAIAAITRNTRTRAAGVGVGGSVKEESGGLVGRFSFRQTVKVERQVEEESLPQERQEKSARRGARRRLNSASATAATPEDNRKKRVKVEKSVVGKQGKAKKHRQPVRVKAEPQVPCPPARARGRGHKEEANKKLSATTAPPKDFESVYRIIEELRHPDGLDQPMRGAPVDEIGCSQAADAVFRADGEERNFHVVVALILSASTTDTIVFDNMVRLKTMKGGLTVDNVLKMSQSQLVKHIRGGLQNNKAKYIRETAEIIKTKFGGKMPRTLKELQTLRGVSRKVGNLTQQTAFGVCEGISVDTHLHRIVNQLRWVRAPRSKGGGPTKNPLQTERELMKWLPREEWTRINPLLVGFGQLTSTAGGYKRQGFVLRQALQTSNPVHALRTINRLAADKNILNFQDAQAVPQGQTVLMEAARLGMSEVVRALLEMGADASLRTADGLSAADYATDDETKAALRMRR